MLAGVDYEHAQRKIALYKKAQTDQVAAKKYHTLYSNECSFNPETGKITVPAAMVPTQSAQGFPIRTDTLVYAARNSKFRIDPQGNCIPTRSGISDLRTNYISNPSIVGAGAQTAVQPDLYRDWSNPPVVKQDNKAEKPQAPQATPAPVPTAPAEALVEDTNDESVKKPVAPTAPNERKSSSDYYLQALEKAKIKTAQAQDAETVDLNTVTEIAGGQLVLAPFWSKRKYEAGIRR